MSVVVGLDIAARSVDMGYRANQKNSKVEHFKQDAEGHRKLIKRLKDLKPSYVVMEATGVYYLDLAVALHEAGLPVAVINPRSAKRFAELKLVNSKTDGVDALLLAEYGERMTPRLWTPPNSTRLALRDIGRQLNRLTGARTQAKNRLHALQAKKMTLGLLVEDEQEAIELLEKRMDRLQRAALELIEQDSVLARHLAHMSTAKGVGTASAIAILAELCVLPEHLKACQVSRHAGMDVRLHQSGTSVSRPARLSKAGNAYLRAGLFMPAMSAVQHDARAKAFYDALVARGKTKLQAICAVMRKYLTGLWACMKTDTPFDSSCLFSDIHLKNA